MHAHAYTHMRTHAPCGFLPPTLLVGMADLGTCRLDHSLLSCAPQADAGCQAGPGGPMSNGAWIVDSSPPARLLSTRPCCGPGPERRPVLGEAPRFHAQAKALMSPQDIPKYACPDLVTRPGYWAKALPENLALRDTVLAYWVDRHGRVFYSVNDGEPVLFHCGVAVGGPLWALIDVYGITDEVQLLGTLQSSPVIPSPSGSLSGSQDDSDSDMAFSVNQSSSASESSLVTAPSSPLSPPVSPVFPPPEPAGSKNGECTVCFDGEVDTVIYTCGHMCLCTSCGLRLKRQARACCPICRRPIKDVIKIYRP
ncbi:PREDICTED: E3 ubiquitin-protein ligase NEURL1B [Myotis davidii]|nr:PREDICTED: E3 ubiquitin-protein ligase NEURL1B [Myotis davidii]